MNFVISYSCGKDSALALYRMVREGHKPVGLLVMFNEEQGRSWFHGVDKPLLEAVSKSLNIPLILCECKACDYNAAIETGLVRAKELGAEVAVFGDIDIQEHREWGTERCRVAGLDAVFPLWQQDRLALTHEVIDIGFKAVIKCVEKSKVHPKFLGTILHHDIINEIIAGGADACGENGEYHTFVFDGPIFSFPLPIEMGEVIDFETHAVIDIRYKRI